MRVLIAVDERVGGVADRDDRRDRHAPLAGRAVARRDRGVGGQVDVGVGQDDHVVLGAAERLHALAVARARSRRCSGRSASSRRSETAATSGCVEERVDRHLVAVDDVEHAVGKPGLGEQLGGAERRATGPSRRA